MKAVILAGGRGTRLGEISSMKPKPMVEIGNKPIIWHIMKTFDTQGYKNFILTLGYMLLFWPCGLGLTICFDFYQE